MKIKFPKQLFTVGIRTSILVSTAIDSAFAVNLNYSGRFGNTISCSIEGLPSDRRCSFEDLKGGSFQGFLEFDESLALNRNTATPRLSLFNKAGINIDQRFFIVAGVDLKDNVANLTFNNNFTCFEEFLAVSFQAPGVTNITEPFGAFINGNYRRRDGLSRRISQSINIVDANVTTSKVPEGSLVLGIFTCFGLSCLLRKAKNSPILLE